MKNIVAIREPIFSIDRPDQWTAVISGRRVELIEFLSAVGPCSVFELAQHMDVAADSLYHHIKKLVATGIVREVGVRNAGRQVERLYDVVADEFDFHVELETGRNVGLFWKLAKSLLRRAERLFEKALDARAGSLRPGHRDTHARSDTAWLTREQVDVVNGHLMAIREIYAEGRRQRAGALYCFQVVMCPVVRSRTARSRPTGRTEKSENGGLDGADRGSSGQPA